MIELFLFDNLKANKEDGVIGLTTEAFKVIIIMVGGNVAP